MEEGDRLSEASGADGLLAIGGGLTDHRGAFNIDRHLKLALLAVPTTAGTARSPLPPPSGTGRIGPR